ncbi:hypothetical protein [Massilia litorea]|uniref:Uncharacterized protein n=1 Tax=Massilia litorea TaxID=2769491 RepID=A0A7L9U2J8_9BURK|nr:hypothetical protein [Massilia litorea]QOL49147.1 hypothetical protein LPB04_19825 [Massilia litorea]
MNTNESQDNIGVEAGRRPRRRIAQQLVERGQRLRSRAGVLIGLSLGLVALLTMLE